MGKGGANPYPDWWATSDKPVHKDKPTDWDSPDMKPYKEYYENKMKYKRQQDQYYKEKSWKQRRQEFEQEFKRKFMEGEYFESNSNTATCNTFSSEDIHPIFNIKRSSSEEDFKKEYKKLILQHHPDKGGDASMFIKVKDAWDTLKKTFI